MKGSQLPTLAFCSGQEGDRHHIQRFLPTFAEGSFLAWGTFTNETNLSVLPQVQKYLQLPNPQSQTTGRIISFPLPKTGQGAPRVSPPLPFIQDIRLTNHQWPSGAGRLLQGPATFVRGLLYTETEAQEEKGTDLSIAFSPPTLPH